MLRLEKSPDDWRAGPPPKRRKLAMRGLATKQFGARCAEGGGSKRMDLPVKSYIYARFRRLVLGKSRPLPFEFELRLL